MTTNRTEENMVLKQFIKKAQKKKMKELWDNKEDGIWETI